jgi:ParB family chromosome partitioning protein
VKAGKQEEVTVAVQKLVAGELDQAAAVAQAGQVVSAVAKSAKVKIEPKVIKTGRATYCSLRRIDKTIRLDFKSTDEAEALEQAIFELIEAHSKKEKDGS